MFTDGVKLRLIAGKGGNGVVAWRREKYVPKGGPCGGDGGKGGSIIIESSHDIFSLDHFRNRKQVVAKNGSQGGPNLRKGRNGINQVLKVPCGTLIKNAETGHVLHDLTEHGERIEICKGGKGGLGNDTFKTPTNRAPIKCTPGRLGESMEVELELKLIADVGFVGFPNAGKSTLLSAITSAEVKIGNYPFTTLTPNLSYIEYDDYTRTYLADIPGIIKGASENRGLGLAFLKHIERCSKLVILLDASGIDGRTPLEDYKALRSELEAYSKEMMEKPHLIVLNKIDAETAQPLIEEFQSQIAQETLQISAQEKLGLDEVIERVKTDPRDKRDAKAESKSLERSELPPLETV